MKDASRATLIRANSYEKTKRNKRLIKISLLMTLHYYECTFYLKADMSYIPLEMAAIFFVTNLFPKPGISPYRDLNSRPLIFKSSA